MNCRLTAKFRVVTGNVELEKGIILPPGLYDGYVEVMDLILGGHSTTQVAKAVIPLSKELLGDLGVDAPSLGEFYDMEVKEYLGSGDVVQVQEPA